MGGAAAVGQVDWLGWDLQQQQGGSKQHRTAHVRVVSDDERVRVAEETAERAWADYEALEDAVIEVYGQLEEAFMERPKMHKNWRSCQCRFCIWDQSVDAKLPVMRRKVFRAKGE